MPNRLAREASPYLQQHADNPVDWYAWGQEALSRAVREDRPILLSIGYSACHWCHVMERESFEDEAIAALMNEHYVCIKVDREERPDLDQIYQLVVQIMGRNGGWPLTVFLTPDQKPFFAGTYFPPADRYGMPGFPKVLAAVAEAYRERHGEVAEQAGEIVRAIETVTRPQTAGAEIGPEMLAAAAERLGARFDDEHGGFGSRPKFPSTMALDVLLRRGALDGDARALARVRHALDAMRAGGIHDQLGGGFHRYSTDERWLVPHFEKMLYDNALLLRLYVDGWRVTGDERYEDTARGIVAYLAREMTHPDGGFFATQDADSEGEEGRFFVWDEADVRGALPGDDEAVRVALARWGITKEGNFEDTGKTVLSATRSCAEIATDLGITESAGRAAAERARVGMLAHQEERPHPFRDEKVMASWNGLTISALADAAGALNEPSWRAMAERAFAHVWSRLVEEKDGQARARRHLKDETVKGPGFLDDQAFLASAALDLYELTADVAYVARARALADGLLAHFAGDDGALFFAADDAERLIARTQDAFDHAVPSATSVAAAVLLRLGTLCGAGYTERGEAVARRLAGPAASNPAGFASALLVIDRLVRGASEVVLVGTPDDTRPLAREAFRAYLPDRSIGHVDPARSSSREAVPEIAQDKPVDRAPTAYLCRGRVCSAALTTPQALREALQEGESPSRNTPDPAKNAWK